MNDTTYLPPQNIDLETGGEDYAHMLDVLGKVAHHEGNLCVHTATVVAAIGYTLNRIDTICSFSLPGEFREVLGEIAKNLDTQVKKRHASLDEKEFGPEGSNDKVH